MRSTCVLCGATANVKHANDTVPHEPCCPHFMRGPDPGGDPYEWTTIQQAIEEAETMEKQPTTGDPERDALIEKLGATTCPCGIDLTVNGCYRCLVANGATYTGDPEAEARFHGRPNPALV